MVFKLTVLHVLNQRQIELRHIILVHVEQDVADHDNALLNLLPNAIELSQELLVVGHFDILSNWLQELNRGVLNAFVEHLSVLVENKAVGGPVELFVAQTARLLIIDLVDSILDGLPVLLGLRALHVCVPHLVSVNQELVCW